MSPQSGNGQWTKTRETPSSGYDPHTMRTCLFAFAMLTALVGRSQTTGTEHWLAYMENLNLLFNGPPAFSIVISSEADATGSITFPATSFTLPFTVQAGHDTALALPPNIYYPEGDEDIVNLGMRITSDVPVAVYAYHHRAYFSEASLVLPYSRLASDYLVMAHEDADGVDPGEFVVVATADGTEVEITPSILTAGLRPPGIPFTVTLDEGQVFQVQAIGDLSGTRVRSLDAVERIAVFAGARQANVGCGLSADDHLYNQTLPYTEYGERFIAVPFKNQGGDEFRLMAKENNTQVTIGTSPAITLMAGEPYSTLLAAPTLIVGSKPITVGQFNESQDCNPSVGDPCFLALLPISRKDTRFIWSALDAGTPSHAVNLVVQGTAVPTVTLDGADITSAFLPVANAPGNYYARLEVTAGEHEVVCDAGIWGAAYGMGDYNSYAFSLGYEDVSDVTGIMDSDRERSTIATWSLGPGEPWPSGMFCVACSSALVMDAAGRVVAVIGAGDRQRPHSLPPGSYQIIQQLYGAPRSTARLIVHP